MLDFTRAFRTTTTLRAPAVLRAIDCDLLERLRALDRDTLRRAVGSHLTTYEADAILKRRDLIVARFDRLLSARGAAGISPSPPDRPPARQGRRAPAIGEVVRDRGFDVEPFRDRVGQRDAPRVQRLSGEQAPAAADP